jgi:YD repeat-containing protein
VYNGRSLIERINYADDKTARFVYDYAGQLIQMTDWTGTTDFTLDEEGRITAVNDHNDREISFRYDTRGNQYRVNYPDDTHVTRTFDSMGRITEVQTPNGLFEYDYTPTGRVNSITMPNGITETFEHDSFGRVLSITQHNPDDTTELLNSYTYDPTGNVTHRENAPVPEFPNTIRMNTYNEMNQLVTQTERDFSGNIVAQFGFTHDKRGNLIEERDTFNANGTSRTFDFDARNQMVRGVNHKGEESHYTYNALGILTLHKTITENGTHTTDFVIDYTSFVPNALMAFGSDGINTRHIYGNNLSRISTTLTHDNQTETFFIQNDRLGSARFATNATGTRVAHTNLDEWGNILNKRFGSCCQGRF